MADASKGPSKPELGADSNEFKGTINSMSLKYLKTIRDRVSERLREVSEDSDIDQVSAEKEVEQQTPGEMTWQVDGKSFTLPVKDIKQVYKAFSKTIPQLKVRFESSPEGLKELERVLREEYMLQLSKNVDLTNYDLQKFEFNIKEIFEEGYKTHSVYHL